MLKSKILSCLGAAALSFAAPSATANITTGDNEETTAKKLLDMVGFVSPICQKRPPFEITQLAEIDQHIFFIKKWIDNNGGRDESRLVHFLNLAKHDEAKTAIVKDAYHSMNQIELDYKAGTLQGLGYLAGPGPRTLDIINSYIGVSLAFAQAPASADKMLDRVDGALFTVINDLLKIATNAQRIILGYSSECPRKKHGRVLEL